MEFLIKAAKIKEGSLRQNMKKILAEAKASKKKLTPAQKQLKAMIKAANDRKEAEHRQSFLDWCENNELPKPVWEFKFAYDIGRKWRIDWYFEHEGKKLAVEVEGGISKIGRHQRAAGFRKDMEKYNALSQYGITLYRVEPITLFNYETSHFIRNFFGIPFPEKWKNKKELCEPTKKATGLSSKKTKTP